MAITIQKRDGTTEEFDPKKIAAVLTAAGLEQESINTVILNVQNWLANQTENLLTTLQIRDQVLQELEIVDPYIAGLYKWYEKTKESPTAV